MTKLKYSLLASLFLVTLAAAAQDEKAIDVKKQIDEKKFVFVAEYMRPMRGGQRYLTTRYTVKVSGDSLVCDLPYVGRLYSASMNPSDGGINFTSTKFEYTVKAKKKGWDVSIKTQDRSPSVRMNITLFASGTGTINVNATDREAISYTGHLEKK